MTRAELKSNAKEQLKGKFGTLLIICVVIIAITAACTLIPAVGFVINFIITPAFTLALMIVLLKIVRNQEISVQDAFCGFNQLGRALWLYVQKVIFTFLWSLLLFIPGIIKSYSYAMAEFILADNPDLTANECITKSRMMMDGHKMEFFVLQLSFIGWSLLGCITLGIALIWVIPYMNVTFANFYEYLKNEEKSTPASEQEVVTEPEAIKQIEE